MATNKKSKRTGAAKYFLIVGGIVLVSTALSVAASRRVLPENFSLGQTTTMTQPATTSTAPATTTSRRTRRRRSATTQAVQPAAATGSLETPAQRAQDQRVLSQQQAASLATKQVNDQQVQAYDANRKKIQDEPRIQDAPTLQDAPRAPVTPDPAPIQEAPGPAQTVPVPPAASPQG